MVAIECIQKTFNQKLLHILHEFILHILYTKSINLEDKSKQMDSKMLFTLSKFVQSTECDEEILMGPGAVCIRLKLTSIQNTQCTHSVYDNTIANVNCYTGTQAMFTLTVFRLRHERFSINL